MKKTNNGEQQSQQIPRRKFIQTAGIAAAGVTIVPRHVLGGAGFQAPSDTVNVAGVGVGGMGRSNMTALSSQNIVALCDVDWDYAGKGFDNLATQAANAQKRLSEASPYSPGEGCGRVCGWDRSATAWHRQACRVGFRCGPAGVAHGQPRIMHVLGQCLTGNGG